MSGVLIDVIVPVLNGANTIRAALQSIQQQTFSDFRIIVVDDGSTDSTPQILAEFAQCDSRFCVLTKPNSGIVDALNLGLEQCRAEFIARHDADDLASPNRFADQLYYLRTHPGCIAVSGAARHIDEHNRPTGHIAYFESPTLSDPTRVPSREPYLLHPFLMARRSSMQLVRGYRHVYHAEDTDLYWRLQEIGQLDNMAVILGDYRMHSQSITSSSSVNGRIGALSSQLAGISAIRRRAKRPDLAFPRDAIQRYQAAGSLDSIFEVGCRGLDKHEVEHLEISVAAKMLETASYRLYDLDMDDCRFIRQAVAKHLNRVSLPSRAYVGSLLSGTAARLAHQRMFAEAAALLPKRFYVGAALRLGFRAGFPKPVRRIATRLIGRGSW